MTDFLDYLSTQYFDKFLSHAFIVYSSICEWILGKAVTKQEGTNFFLAAQKMVSFTQLPTVEKDTIFGATIKNFCPSYFVTAFR